MGRSSARTLRCAWRLAPPPPRRVQSRWLVHLWLWIRGRESPVEVPACVDKALVVAESVAGEAADHRHRPRRVDAAGFWSRGSSVCDPARVRDDHGDAVDCPTGLSHEVKPQGVLLHLVVQGGSQVGVGGVRKLNAHDRFLLSGQLADLSCGLQSAHVCMGEEDDVGRGVVVQAGRDGGG